LHAEHISEFPFHLLWIVSELQSIISTLTSRDEPKKQQHMKDKRRFPAGLDFNVSELSLQIDRWRENTCHYQLPVDTRKVSTKALSGGRETGGERELL
jgi:hypothetical protein